MSIFFVCGAKESRVRWKINKWQRSTFRGLETKAKPRHTYLSLPRISCSFTIAKFPTLFFSCLCIEIERSRSIKKNQLKLAERKLRFTKSDYVSVAFDRLEISLGAFDLKAINDFFIYGSEQQQRSFFITHH